MEIWDGYLKDGSLAGIDLVRGEPIPEGLYHLVCDILVRHADGDYLLMQRDFSKPNFGGYFEATAGGSALKGEDKITCAKRELLEETGIVAGSLEEIGKFLFHNTIYFQFLCRTDCDKASVALQEGETISYKWLTEKEFIAFVNSDELIPGNKVRCADYFKDLGYAQDIRDIPTYESCAAFVEEFFEDPIFSDPMLTCDEQLQTNLLNALRKPETHRVFGVYRADRLVGLFAFLVLPEEHYAEMLVGLSRNLMAYQEMLSYLEDNLPGYDVDFVFNPRNHMLRRLLVEGHAEFEAEEQKMVLGDSLPEFDTTGVELFSESYAQQYFNIHNKDMYWTGEKVAAAPERFRTFLAIENGQVVGYMDVTHSFEENEPFDLFVLPEFRGKGYGKKLLTKAIQMNAPKGMMLLVEADNEPAIRLYQSVGFVKAEGPNYLTAHLTI